MTEHVFISYASEDYVTARRLNDEIRSKGFNTWLDKESILPGQDWNREIRRAIKESTYFIPLLSSISVSKRGYIQKEFKLALDVLDEIPEGQIFVIPARVDECDIPYEKLRRYQYVDLFPDWYSGIDKIIKAIKALRSTKV